MNNTYLEILAILLLIIANGFFSLSEFSIIASRRSKLKQMARDGNKSAARASKIQSRPESFLATVQVGITFVGVLAGVFSGMTIVATVTPLISKIPVGFIARSARSISFLLVVVIISFLTVILGELVPKYIALSKPEKIAARVARPISWFTRISFFVVRLLNGAARLFLRLIGLKKIPERSSITEDEINLIIAEGREKGLFDETEQELIHSVFDFADTTARQAMTPRTDIIGVDINEDKDAILHKITKHGFSRYPVYQDSLDKIEGIIYTKDIIRILLDPRLFIIRDLIRKAIFVPDSMMLSEILATFQRKKVHVAIVLDEFGGTAGLVTLEDILEEIVGEIQDEHDYKQREFVKETDILAFASGSYRVDELNDSFNTNLPEAGPETLGGLVFSKLEHPAARGEEITIEGIHFTVLEVSGNRIKRLQITKPPPKKKK